MITRMASDDAVQERASECSYAFVGRSAAFTDVDKTILSVAPWDCPIVITGETGTGKEMVARKIHVTSRRRSQIFVPVDCTTLTGQLFESQLFGHVRGAFTGAMSDTLGFFRAADGGTIFLDEIGELPLDLQAKLLRVLQEGQITPLGAVKPVKVDVRVLCATNRNLREMVRQEKFRADLFYRLNVVQIEVIPLRERKEDIPMLAEYFLEKQARLYGGPAKRLSEHAREAMIAYSWPGNVREVANVMERAYVLSQSAQEIGMAMLPNEIVSEGLAVQPEQSQQFPTMNDVTRQLVIRALQVAGGHKMRACELLRIDYGKLSRLMKKYNLSASYK
jgi:transcriptional regulator with PAS, ATPase and Fis domain